MVFGHLRIRAVDGGGEKDDGRFRAGLILKAPSGHLPDMNLV